MTHLNIEQISEQCIDVTEVRGDAEDIVRKELSGWFVWSLINQTDGVLWILDDAGVLAGGLVPATIRTAIDDELLELEALEAEANQGSDNKLLENQIIAKRRANKTADIDVRRIVSRRTGKSGWKICWESK